MLDEHFPDTWSAPVIAVAPAYLRVAGILLAAFGLLNIVGFLLLPSDQWGSGREIAFNLAGILVTLAGGLGLFFRRRWGWPFGLLAGITALGIGVASLVATADLAFPGNGALALTLLVIPGALLLASLLTPATLRWMRRADARRS